MTTTTEISNTDDTIDIRDVIARFEELDGMDVLNECETKELKDLGDLLDECEGNGGDEQWRGNWYPVTLINESYFTEYAKELLADCGDLPRDLPHYIAIDWEETASNIMVDYTHVTFNGTTYLVR